MSLFTWKPDWDLVLRGFTFWKLFACFAFSASKLETFLSNTPDICASGRDCGTGSKSQHFEDSFGAFHRAKRSADAGPCRRHGDPQWRADGWGAAGIDTTRRSEAGEHRTKTGG